MKHNYGDALMTPETNVQAGQSDDDPQACALLEQRFLYPLCRGPSEPPDYCSIAS